MFCKSDFLVICSPLVDKCIINLQGILTSQKCTLENTCYLGFSFLLNQVRINHAGISFTPMVGGKCY